MTHMPKRQRYMNYTITKESGGTYRVERRGDGFISIPPISTLKDIFKYIGQEERQQVSCPNCEDTLKRAPK